MMDTLNGMPIIISNNAQKVTWHWPDKRRSKRLIKKLTRLRGPQVTTEPQSFVVAGNLVMHPSLYHEMKRRFDHDSRS